MAASASSQHADVADNIVTGDDDPARVDEGGPGRQAAHAQLVGALEYARFDFPVCVVEMQVTRGSGDQVLVGNEGERRPLSPTSFSSVFV